MKKLIFSTVCILSLLTANVSAAEYHFQDASRIPWAAASIEKLYQNGVIKGVSDKEFAPYSSMTRAQFAAISVKLKTKKVVQKDFPFKDVSRNDWYYDQVKKMYQMGIIKGVSRTQYDPDKPVTREEAAVILARTFDYSYKGQYSLKFNDKNQISPWAVNSVKALANKGFFSLFGNQFKPQQPINRAEIAVILHLIVYGQPEKYVAPKTASRSSQLVQQRMTNVIDSVLGTPYKYGGTTTKGFDCSGFTGYVYEQLDVDLPRDSRSQFTVGDSVPVSQMQKGDLIFFDTGGGQISHVGIFVGNNKMAHAASGRGEVKIDDLSWYLNNYNVVGVKRVM